MRKEKGDSVMEVNACTIFFNKPPAYTNKLRLENKLSQIHGKRVVLISVSGLPLEDQREYVLMSDRRNAIVVPGAKEIKQIENLLIQEGITGAIFIGYEKVVEVI